jgi:hypothetical protein
MANRISDTISPYSIAVAPAKAGAFHFAQSGQLLSSVAQLAGHVTECVLQLAAERIHDCDDRDRNPGGNQPIFDRRGRRFVTRETFDDGHPRLPVCAVQLFLDAASFADISKK